MRKASKGKTMTELLRQALNEADNKYAVTKATGVPKASLIRFLRGDQSLRLDMADRLAAYLGIECIWRKGR
jgi:plasmid maintenance system antidote protein VapI